MPKILVNIYAVNATFDGGKQQECQRVTPQDNQRHARQEKEKKKKSAPKNEK